MFQFLLFIFSIVGLYAGWLLFKEIGKTDNVSVRTKWLKALYAYYFTVPILLIPGMIEYPVIWVEIFTRLIAAVIWSTIFYQCAYAKNGYKMLYALLWLGPLVFLGKITQMIEVEPLLVLLFIPDGILLIVFWRRSKRLYRLNRKLYLRPSTQP
jgi:uncharacterized membrane protein